MKQPKRLTSKDIFNNAQSAYTQGVDKASAQTGVPQSSLDMFDKASNTHLPDYQGEYSPAPVMGGGVSQSVDFGEEGFNQRLGQGMRAEMNPNDVYYENQSTSEKLAKGVVNVASGAAIKALEGIAVLGSAVAEGGLKLGDVITGGLLEKAGYDGEFNLDDVTENPVVKGLFDSEQWMKDNLGKVYQPSNWDDKSFLQQVSNSAWWGSEGADGIAFALSNFVPAGLLGKAGLGAKLVGGLADLGEMNAATKFLTAGRAGLLKGAKIGEMADRAVSTAFMTSSESLFEAKDTGDTMTRNYLRDYNSKNPNNPVSTIEELDKIDPVAAADIKAKKGDAMKHTFFANMAALSASNWIEAGLLSKMMGKGTTSLIGKEIEAGGKFLDPLEKIQRKGLAKFFKDTRLGSTIKTVAEQMATEGLYEENIQNAIQNVSQNMAMNGKIDNMKFIEQVAKETVTNLGDKEAWKSIGAGMVIGGLFGGVGNMGIPGVSKGEFKERQEQVAEGIAKLNAVSDNLRNVGQIYTKDENGNDVVDTPKLQNFVANLIQAKNIQQIHDYYKGKGENELAEIVKNEHVANYVKGFMEAGLKEDLLTKVKDLQGYTEEDLTKFGFDPLELNTDGVQTTVQQRFSELQSKVKDYANQYQEIQKDIPDNERARQGEALSWYARYKHLGSLNEKLDKQALQVGINNDARVDVANITGAINALAKKHANLKAELPNQERFSLPKRSEQTKKELLLIEEEIGRMKNAEKENLDKYGIPMTPGVEKITVEETPETKKLDRIRRTQQQVQNAITDAKDHYDALTSKDGGEAFYAGLASKVEELGKEGDIENATDPIVEGDYVNVTDKDGNTKSGFVAVDESGNQTFNGTLMNDYFKESNTIEKVPQEEVEQLKDENVESFRKKQVTSKIAELEGVIGSLSERVKNGEEHVLKQQIEKEDIILNKTNGTVRTTEKQFAKQLKQIERSITDSEDLLDKLEDAKRRAEDDLTTLKYQYDNPETREDVEKLIAKTEEDIKEVEANIAKTQPILDKLKSLYYSMLNAWKSLFPAKEYKSYEDRANEIEDSIERGVDPATFEQEGIGIANKLSDYTDYKQDLQMTGAEMRALERDLDELKDTRTALYNQLEEYQNRLAEYELEANKLNYTKPLRAEQGQKETSANVPSRPKDSSKNPFNDRKSKDVSKALFSTAGSHVKGDGLTTDRTQLRFFKFAESYDPTTKSNRLRTVTINDPIYGVGKEQDIFKEDAKEYQHENHVKALVIDKQGNPVYTNGDLTFTSLAEPRESFDKNTNVDNWSNSKIKDMVESYSSFITKAKAEPQFVDITSRSNGMARRGEPISIKEAFGTEDVPLKVITNGSTVVGEKEFPLYKGLVYATANNRPVGLIVRNLSINEREAAVERLKEYAQVRGNKEGNPQSILKQLTSTFFLGQRTENPELSIFFIKGENKLVFGDAVITHDELVSGKYDVQLDQFLSKLNHHVDNKMLNTKDEYRDITGKKWDSYNQYLTQERENAPLMSDLRPKSDDIADPQFVGTYFEFSQPKSKTASKESTGKGSKKVKQDFSEGLNFRVNVADSITGIGTKNEEVEETKVEKAISKKEALIDAVPHIPDNLNVPSFESLFTEDEIKEKEKAPKEDITVGGVKVSADDMAEFTNLKASMMADLLGDSVKEETKKEKPDLNIGSDSLFDGLLLDAKKINKENTIDIGNEDIDFKLTDISIVSSPIYEGNNIKYDVKVKGKKIGEVLLKKDENIYRIYLSSLNFIEEARNYNNRKGIGTVAYQLIGNDIINKGGIFTSDYSRNSFSDNLWKKLTKLNKAVKQRDKYGDFYTYLADNNINSLDVYSPIDIEKEEEWFKYNISTTIPFKKVAGLIDGKAFGKFTKNGQVLISDAATAGTVYHEAFHVVSNLYLTPKEQETLHDEWRDKNGYQKEHEFTGLASNGKPSLLYKSLLDNGLSKEEAIEAYNKTKTEEFKKWFNGSKVVDENNEPLVVYHGTKEKNLTEFDKNKINDYLKKDEWYKRLIQTNAGEGFYFTPDKQMASWYKDKKWETKGALYPVFLNIQNPHFGQDWEAWKTKKGNSDGFVSNVSQNAKPTDINLDSEIVVYKSTQVKSIFNNGGFDSLNNNIFDSESKTKESKSDVEVEEALAEEFREFMLTDQSPYKTWFSKIVDFVKGLIGLDSSKKEKLFERIKQGAFSNAESVSRSNIDLYSRVKGLGATANKELMDGMTVTLFANLFKNGFDVGDIRSFNKGELGSEKDSQFKNIYNDTFNRVLADINLYAPDMVNRTTSKSDFIKMLNSPKMKEAIVANHIQHLMQFNVKFNMEEDTDLQNLPENDKGRDTLGIVDSIEFSTKNSMPPAVKILIASLPQVQVIDGNKSIKRSPLGLTIPTDYRRNVSILHNTLANINDFEKQVQAIQSLVPRIPEFNMLINKLNTKDVTTKDGFFVQSQFRQQFDKNRYTFFMQLYDGANSYIMDANSSRMVDLIKAKWQGALRRESKSLKIEDGQQLLNEKYFAKYDKLNDVRADTLSFYKDLGITFSNADEVNIDSLADTMKALMIDIKEGDVSADIFNQDGIKGYMNRVVEEEIKTSMDYSDNQHISPSGKTVYNISLNDYLSIVSSEMNDTGLPPHLQWNEEKQEGNPLMRHSIWGDKINKGKKIQTAVLEGARIDEVGEIGKVMADLTRGEAAVFQFSSIMNGIFPFLRAGDKGLEKGFSFGEKASDIRIQEANEIMRGYLSDEILSAYMLNVEGIGADVKEYNKFGKTLRIFEGVLGTKDMKDATKYMNDEKKSRKQIVELIDKFVERDSVKSAMDNYLDSKVKDNIQELVNNRVIEARENGFVNLGLPSEIISKFTDDSATLTKGQMESIVGQFTYQSLIANIEQTKLFTGDIAFFKDFFKRTSGLVGTGKTAWVGQYVDKLLNTLFPRTDKQSDSKLDTWVFNDVVAASNTYNEYVDAFVERGGFTKTEAENILKNYLTNEEADAQGYITLPEYREFNLRMGDWTNDREEVYQKALNNQKLSKSDTQMLNPEKPQMYAPQEYDELYAPTFYKLSVMPLIPSVIKGTTLEALNNNMLKNKIGISVFASGNKVGAKNVRDFYNNEGGFNTDNTSISHTLNYKYMKKQLDINPEGKDKVIFGTQFRKLILSGLMGKSLSINGSKVEGSEIIKEFNSLIDKQVQNELNKLVDKLGITKDGSNFKITNVNVLKEMLKDEARSRTSPDNLIESFDAMFQQGDVKPVELSVNRNKIEQILMSLVNNNIIKQKVRGGSLVQAASTGFETKPRRQSEVSKEKWASNLETLQFYRPTKGGTLAMEVYLPFKYKEMMGIDNVSQIDDRLKEMIAFRIPTQGLNSIEAIVVKDFLPREAGDLIIVPTEGVTKSGWDFDVDKLNVFYPNYEMVKGKPTYIEGDTQNRIIELSRQILLAKENFVPLTTPNTTDDLLKMEKEIASLNPSLGRNDSQRSKFVDWSYNLNIRQTYLLGKSGVGQAALQNVNHVMAQIAKLGMKKTNEIYLKHHVDAEGNIDLSQEKDVDGNKTSIQDIISQTLNGFVDIARDPFLKTLNITPETSNVFFFLTRIGTPLRQTTLFLNQPIIRDYLTELESNSAMFLDEKDELNRKELVDRVMDKYSGGSDVGGLEGYKDELSEAKLAKNIKGEYNNTVQRGILEDFINYKTDSEALVNLIQAVNFDTSNSPSIEGARTKVENYFDLKKEDKFVNIDKMLTQTFLGSFAKATENSIGLYKDLFLTENNQDIRNVLDIVKKDVKAVRGLDIEKFMNTAKNDMLSHLIQNSKVGSSETKIGNFIKAIFVDKKSNLATSIASLKESPLSDNYFIRELTPILSRTSRAEAIDSEDVNNLKMFTKRLVVEEQNLVTDAWRELFEYQGTTPQETNYVQGLANDLMVMAILQSGLNNSPLSFTQFIPNEYYFSLSSKLIDNALDGNVDLNEFREKFYKNNYKSSDIVPRIKDGKKVGNGLKSRSERPFVKTWDKQKKNWKLYKNTYVADGKSFIFEQTNKLGDGFNFKEFASPISVLASNNVSAEQRPIEQHKTTKNKLIEQVNDSDFNDVTKAEYIKRINKAENIQEVADIVKDLCA